MGSRAERALRAWVGIARELVPHLSRPELRVKLEVVTGLVDEWLDEVATERAAERDARTLLAELLRLSRDVGGRRRVEAEEGSDAWRRAARLAATAELVDPSALPAPPNPLWRLSRGRPASG